MSDKGSMYKIYWGDTHHNTYMGGIQNPPMHTILKRASGYLDFYTGALYTPKGRAVPIRKGWKVPSECAVQGHPQESAKYKPEDWIGVRAEGTKMPDQLAREWKEFEQATAEAHQPGRFVTFPGYEWQGNGEYGDHNVFYLREGNPVFTVSTLPELYRNLRSLKAIAIPHHIGYHPGIRAPVWKNCNVEISPFAEIFSVHGCSETDEEWVGLRRNAHMGPGTGGGTYQDALDAGLHIGAICSTDNWKNMPACWGEGVMACLATSLTREGLWEAFRARRVYGVTGDRIKLDFTCNGAPMGSILPKTKRREICVEAVGSDAIDRIELLKNGRVVATTCHQGAWDVPRGRKATRFKVRIEAGWGCRIGEIPFTERKWQGALSVSGGRIVGWEPCWIYQDQGVPRIEGRSARFTMISRQESVTRPFQGATIFEVEAAPDAELVLTMNELQARDTMAGFSRRSRVIWFKQECVKRLKDATGITPADLPREDPQLYQWAYKVKMHRMIPEAGYTAHLSYTDDEPLKRETHYRVRVEQRNGQRAWSSPIWIKSLP